MSKLQLSIRQEFEKFTCLIKNTAIKTLNGSSISLSTRESECLFLLARGKTKKEIGALLSLSSRTVETYINNIKNKTNTRYKSELIDIFYNNFKTSIQDACQPLA